MYNILVVEDEAIVALEIKRTLVKIGDYFVTHIATNYDEALRYFDEFLPDIVLLDIHLKKSKDGIEIAKEMKQRVSDIPILYLTAFCDDNTINKAVETEPIGYLVKPFKRDDLKTTLQLATYKIRSQEHIDSSLYSIGYGYFFDKTNQTLFYKKYPIQLSLKERRLLEILIEARGKIVPFYTLEEYIWNGNPVSESAIRTLLYRLRSKLEYKLIETIPSFGLRLILPT